MNIGRKLSAGILLPALLTPVFLEAQGAPAAQPSSASSAVANPTYTFLVMEIDVNRPAAEVWEKVGGYCDIEVWLPYPAGCTILAGDGVEVGSVRSVVSEILVGRTELSYTYTQPVREGRPYNMYHGTLEARPVNESTSKIVYTLMWDNSMLADDAAREQDRDRRRTQFERALANMKIIAEGGTLP